MVRDLNMRVGALKLLDENTGENSLCSWARRRLVKQDTPKNMKYKRKI